MDGDDTVHDTEDVIARLNELRDAANEACREAFNRRKMIQGPVNWGDLGCVKTELCLSNDGEQFLRVYIEEASPDAFELAAFIAEILRPQWGAVNVVTEW